MRIQAETTEAGVTECLFEITVNGAPVPAVLWTAQGARGPRPLLLIGHGGGRNKTFPPLAAGARRHAAEQGYAVLAIDAPGHGERATPELSARFAAAFRQPPAPSGCLSAQAQALLMEVAEQAAPEWQAALDAVQSLDRVGASGPVGYVGVSLGGLMGIMLAAREPRIRAAVFGLVGPDAGSPLHVAARQLRIPVQFAMQWDDELVPRANALALFDSIGSQEKTLHANPGRHMDLPAFERAGWDAFFARHLG
jgi:pimeloyl-ACP methyl ester carboxylesterase